MVYSVSSLIVIICIIGYLLLEDIYEVQCVNAADCKEKIGLVDEDPRRYLLIFLETTIKSTKFNTITKDYINDFFTDVTYKELYAMYLAINTNVEKIISPLGFCNAYQYESSKLLSTGQKKKVHSTRKINDNNLFYDINPNEPLNDKQLEEAMKQKTNFGSIKKARIRCMERLGEIGIHENSTNMYIFYALFFIPSGPKNVIIPKYRKIIKPQITLNLELVKSPNDFCDDIVEIKNLIQNYWSEYFMVDNAQITESYVIKGFQPEVGSSSNNEINEYKVYL